jgi:hypothetical protein
LQPYGPSLPVTGRALLFLTLPVLNEAQCYEGNGSQAGWWSGNSLDMYL